MEKDMHIFGLFKFTVIEMSTAVLIPGNGVASNDPSMCEYDLLADKCAIRKPEYVSGAFLHIFVWLFVEVIMHIIMMVSNLAKTIKWALI